MKKKMKNDYYHLDLYFPTNDKSLFPIYGFLSRLSAKRKLTPFIANFFDNYMKLCGVKHPERLSDEELSSLPSLEQLVKDKCFDMLLSGLSGNITINTNSRVPTPTTSIQSKTGSSADTYPSRNIKEDDAVAEDDFDDDPLDNSTDIESDESGIDVLDNWESSLGQFNL